MKFITITLYFNKLQSILFLLSIVPLLTFLAIYYFAPGLLFDPRKEYFIVISSMVMLCGLLAMILFNKRIKSVRNLQGLGAKLDKYFELTIIRFSFLAAGSLMMALGLLLTGSDVFTALYLAGLVLSVVLWPTGRKVSADLRLKGDEREMVYYKKDTF